MSRRICSITLFFCSSCVRILKPVLRLRAGREEYGARLFAGRCHRHRIASRPQINVTPPPFRIGGGYIFLCEWPSRGGGPVLTAIRSRWGGVDTQLASELRYAHHVFWGKATMKKLLHRLIYYLLYRRQCSGFCVTCKYYDICKEELTYGK